MRALELDVEKRRDLCGRLARGTPSKILCLAECYFHTVEAPIEVNVLEKLDEFEVFLLRAVQFLRRPSLRELDGLLHVGRQTLRQAATALLENSLLAEDTGDSLEVTAKGAAAIESGVTTRSEHRRQVFHFIHPSNEYVRVHDVRRSTLLDLKREATPRDWHWDVASLQQPLKSPDEWKRERGFPTDVVRVITKGDVGTNQAPSDNVDDSDTDSQTPTVEVSQLEKYLIVDKAQAGQCVMVVEFEGDSPMELHAYSLVQLRSPGRAAQRTLFSVRGAEGIMRVLPGLEELHAPERLREAWHAVARHCGLEDPHRATIRLAEMQVVVGLDDSLTAEWLAFCWQAVKGEPHVCVSLPEMNCLCMLAIEPRDEISRSRLKALGLLYRVSTMPAAKVSFTDSPTFRAQLEEAGCAGEVNLRELSALAWQLGEFRLAYHLAELEDMVDVHV